MILDLDKVYEVQEPPLLFTRPSILSTPPIPKALHGINPRTIKGKVWWDEQRKKAYKQNNYHCWCCGVWEKNAKPEPWLDAHEIYRVSTKTGRVTLKEIVAVCRTCHSFIHLGRLHKLFDSRQVLGTEIRRIVNHGLSLLKSARVPVTLGFLQEAEYISGIYILRGRYNIRPPYAYDLDWKEWHLVVDGKKYRSKFRDEEEWKRFYSKQ